MNDMPESLARYISEPLYDHANILGEGANKSCRRMNYTSIFCIVTLILGALCMIFH